MADQQGQQPAQVEVASGAANEPKWGDLISAERQAELKRRLDAWAAETDHGERAGPFDGEALTGADVFWLAERVRDGVFGSVSGLHLAGATLAGAHLEHANLDSAQLAGAFLERAQLAGAFLAYARLERATLAYAHLEGAFLSRAHLEGATLSAAHLEGARLTSAHLKGANLDSAQLEGAGLDSAHLEGADLRGASLDKATRLNDATLTDVLLDQITFDNTNLTVVEWDRVPELGDEVLADEAWARDAQRELGGRKPREQRAAEYAAAARAYRLLAVALQSKGLGDIAARYLYRAQIMQRKRRWHERHRSAYLGSAFLALFAGYGYRLGRVFAVYGLTVAFFAALYVVTGVAGGAPLRPETVADAAQISLNAIHGRVFFAQFGLDTVQSWIATAESICGIVIEGVFVAVLIQRLFAR